MHGETMKIALKCLRKCKKTI